MILHVEVCGPCDQATTPTTKAIPTTITTTSTMNLQEFGGHHDQRAMALSDCRTQSMDVSRSTSA